MKALLKIFMACSLLGGLCSCESELPRSGPGFGERLQRGVVGQGTLYVPEPDVTSPFSSGH